MRSMTGFGRGVVGAAGRAFVAEVRAVNHRYLDVAVRLPREHGALEDRVRAEVRSHLRRGRVDVTVAAPAAGGSARVARIDTALAAQYHKLLQEVAAHLQVPYEVDARFFVGLPGVCELREEPADPDADWPSIEQAVAEALRAVVAMREREGTALDAALGDCLRTVEACVRRVQERLPAAWSDQEARLRSRLASVLGGAAPSSGPALDVAALMERADIAEELVRLRSHLEQAAACRRSGEPVGRRLEFLAQEMQREWTTISGKAVDREIADEAVSARVAVEQVREQVQNIE